MSFKWKEERDLSVQIRQFKLNNIFVSTKATIVVYYDFIK